MPASPPPPPLLICNWKWGKSLIPIDMNIGKTTPQMLAIVTREPKSIHTPHWNPTLLMWDSSPIPCNWVLTQTVFSILIAFLCMNPLGQHFPIHSLINIHSTVVLDKMGRSPCALFLIIVTMFFVFQSITWSNSWKWESFKCLVK